MYKLNDKYIKQRRIENPVEHLRDFAEIDISANLIFSQKGSIVDIRLGSNCAPANANLVQTKH